jgi:hypothetical protein
MRHLTLPRREMLLNLAILGVSAHSVLLGLCLLSFPARVLRWVGWTYTGDIFWPCQAGLFLLILGLAYGTAVRYRPLVWLLVGSKASAFVFLMVQALWADAPRLTVLLGAIDGLMGLTVLGLLMLVIAGMHAEGLRNG